MKTDSIPLVETAPAAFAELTRALHATLPMARIEVRSLPDCAVRLGLINADFPTGPLPPDVMHAVIAQPAYWALCWGSGLALAQLIERNPHWVRGRRVLDFGSGSGIAGIAAALAGAARVTACDTDAGARCATQANADLNGVAVEVCAELAPTATFDVVLLADVLYDRDNLPLLDRLQAVAPTIVVADSRIAVIPNPAYRTITEVDARTLPNLGEFDEFKTVRVFVYGSVDSVGT
ncbi:MAG TPA: 50S ribosomal protein L11 methyltransferase [Pseudomonadales bacterium]|nr:50S ribosomal protein L11 methyltransferase [Pseudomonadales bacterium]